MSKNKLTFSDPGKYTASGMPITINSQSIILSPEEVTYLLLEVDGQATASAENPPENIEFMLRGQHYVASNGEWMNFVDVISSCAGAGGWRPL